MLESPSNEAVSGSESCSFAGSVGKGVIVLVSDSCEAVASGTLVSALFEVPKLKCESASSGALESASFVLSKLERDKMLPEFTGSLAKLEAGLPAVFV